MVFSDSSNVDPDVIILGTGNDLRKPFLTQGGELDVNITARDNSTYGQTLTTNTRYIFPLHRHIFAIDGRYPTNALAFVGLPSYIANCPSNIAQSQYVAQAILHPDILGTHEELLQELAEQEDELRRKGLDPYVTGHRMVSTNASSNYQDDLIEYLKEKVNFAIVVESFTY